MALLSLVLLLASAPALADQPAPAATAPAEQKFVDPVILRARAEALRDAVADSSVSDISLKGRAHGFFDKLPEETLVVDAGPHRRVEREPVSGKRASIEGMIATAQGRIDDWKKVHQEPPPPEITASVAEARELQAGKRLSYDSEDSLAPNQMGIFKYMRDSLEGGVVKLNERMKLIGILVGEAFTYATVAHEAQHARDRAAGRLSPEQEVAGEISSFRTQYEWLKLMDPSGERLLTLHGDLVDWRNREHDDKVKYALNEAVVYLEHLSDVVSTNGDKEELEKLVKKLGYSDGHKHEQGDGHEGRGGSAPPSA